MQSKDSESTAWDSKSFPIRSEEGVRKESVDKTIQHSTLMKNDALCPDCGAKLPSGSDNPICLHCVIGGTIRYFGDYELLGELGQGGMGVVYRARQISLNRLVAVKTMRTDGPLASHPEGARRFRNEAEAAASLDHPNIVPVYEVGTHDGFHFLSMKLIEGVTLADWCSSATDEIETLAETKLDRSKVDLSPNSRRSCLRSTREVASALSRIARAVHFAHQRGVLHRDLKPANILVDQAGEVYVTDFGVAKLMNAESHATATGQILGTPAYMAPEQAMGAQRSITTAADIYSLGAILYQSLAGQPPFGAATPVEVLRRATSEEPIPLRQLAPDIDMDLATICHKCLQKSPEARYLSAEALADDLDRWLRGEPIQARPIGFWRTLGMWAKRKPAVAALSLGLILAVAVGSAAALWQFQKAKLEAKRSTRIAETLVQNLSSVVRELSKANRSYNSNLTALVKDFVEKADAVAGDVGDLSPDLKGLMATLLRLSGDSRNASNILYTMPFRTANVGPKPQKNDSEQNPEVTILATLFRIHLEAGKLNEARATLKRLIGFLSTYFISDEGRTFLSGDDSDQGLISLSAAMGEARNRKAFGDTAGLPTLQASTRALAEALTKCRWPDHISRNGVELFDITSFDTTAKELVTAVYFIGWEEDDQNQTLLPLVFERVLPSSGTSNIDQILHALTVLIGITSFDDGSISDHNVFLRTLTKQSTTLASMFPNIESLHAAGVRLEAASQIRTFGDTNTAQRLSVSAIEAARKHLAQLEHKEGKRSVAYSDAVTDWALKLLFHGEDSTQALSYAREGWQIRGELTPNDRQTHIARCVLGVCLVGARQFEEAEIPLAQGAEALLLSTKPETGWSRYWIQEVGDALINYYSTAGKQEKARELREKKESLEKLSH